MLTVDTYITRKMIRELDGKMPLEGWVGIKKIKII